MFQVITVVGEEDLLAAEGPAASTQHPVVPLMTREAHLELDLHLHVSRQSVNHLIDPASTLEDREHQHVETLMHEKIHLAIDVYVQFSPVSSARPPQTATGPPGPLTETIAVPLSHLHAIQGEQCSLNM